MKRHKLTHILNNLLTEDALDVSPGNQTDNVPPVDKKTFMESLQRYHTYAGLFRQNVSEYKKVLDEIKFIVDSAEGVTLNETDGWFDNVTVSRHMKQMKESFKVFEKTIMEAAQINQRLNASYEDIGKTLQNYYDI
jgi:hypothetical protein